jgi:RNA polymerase sigma-70 factor (ECF subfamily)
MVDTDLVARCQAGDPEALSALFVRYHDRVFRLAYLVTRSHQDAQDVTQETFIRLIKASRSFDESKGAFETWLYTIAVNQARDSLRRQKRASLSWDLLQEDRHVSKQSVYPERLSLTKEWQQTIWEAVNGLEEKQRLAVILRYYLDLPCEEIARVLSCPAGTVHSRLYYARLALEKKLGDEKTCLAWALA